jgi:capsular polysaccharide biosynthesis protein
MTNTVRAAEQHEAVDHGKSKALPAPPKPPVAAKAETRTIYISRRLRRTGVLVTVMIAFAVVLTFAGAALGYSLTRPKVYGAEAEIVLTPRPELSDTAVDRVMLTQTMVVKSPSVLQPVAVRAQIPLRRLQKAVTVEMVGRSNVLRITVADRDRDRAVRLVDRIVVEYSQVAPTARNGNSAPVQLTVLSQARPLDRLLEPQPARALAGGALLGVFAAALVVFLLRRPGGRIRMSPYWK